MGAFPAPEADRVLAAALATIGVSAASRTRVAARLRREAIPLSQCAL